MPTVRGDPVRRGPRPDRRRPRHGRLAAGRTRSRPRSAGSLDERLQVVSRPARRSGAAAGRRPPRGAHAVGPAGGHAVVAAARARRTPGHHPAVRDPLAGAAPYGAPPVGRGSAWSPGPHVDRGRGGGHAGGGRVARRARCSRGDRRRRHRGRGPGREGRRAAPRRARPPPRRQPALLRRRAGRRAVVRLRHRPAAAHPVDRGAVVVRARPGLGALRRRGGRHDRRLAARRCPDA